MASTSTVSQNRESTPLLEKQQDRNVKVLKRELVIAGAVLGFFTVTAAILAFYFVPNLSDKILHFLKAKFIPYIPNYCFLPAIVFIAIGIGGSICEAHLTQESPEVAEEKASVEELKKEDLTEEKRVENSSEVQEKEQVAESKEKEAKEHLSIWEAIDVNADDFKPFNEWVVNKDGEKFDDKKTPKYLIDQTTGRPYLNESKGTVRTKCVMLTLGTPFVHPFATIGNVAYRALRLITFANFWLPRDTKGYDLKGRLQATGLDFARIIGSPFALIALELITIYGWFSPYNARKLYATVERLIYGNFILAPCFQPDPKQHAFGGDMGKQGAF